MATKLIHDLNCSPNELEIGTWFLDADDELCVVIKGDEDEEDAKWVVCWRYDGKHPICYGASNLRVKVVLDASQLKFEEE